MELIVNVAKLKGEIEEQKIHYLETQKVARILYAKKVGEYATYVNKCVEENKSIKKAAPYLAYESLTNFNKTIDALSFHAGETIKLTSDEFETIRHGLSYATTNYSSSAATLEALNYTL